MSNECLPEPLLDLLLLIANCRLLMPIVNCPLTATFASI